MIPSRTPVIALLVIASGWTAAPGNAAWTWPQDGAGAAGERNSKALVSPAAGVARPRYDIYDPDSDDFTLPSDVSGVNRPIRPGGFGAGSLNRPFPPGGAYAPGAAYGQGGFGPGAGLGPGGPGYRPGGPYGPVGANGVTKCKCAFPGHCESPSLQFGTCDAGKRYCCTKTARGLPGGRPVLAGPDGPIGIVKGQGYGLTSGGIGNHGGLYGGGNPYGGGAYGGNRGGFGARGDGLYGPQGGFDPLASDFRPGPDFNRRPGTSLR